PSPSPGSNISNQRSLPPQRKSPRFGPGLGLSWDRPRLFSALALPDISSFARDTRHFRTSLFTEHCLLLVFSFGRSYSIYSLRRRRFRDPAFGSTRFLAQPCPACLIGPATLWRSRPQENLSSADLNRD